jgi:hypothetical protein
MHFVEVTSFRQMLFCGDIYDLTNIVFFVCGKIHVMRV